MSLNQNAWVEVLTTIQNTYYRRTMYKSSGDFHTYWLPTEFVGHEDGKYKVACETEEQRAWLEDRGKSIAERMLMGVLKEKVEVEFVT